MANKNEYKVVTPAATLMYPHLFEPTSFEEGKTPTYNCVLVFDKGTDLSSLVELVRSCAKDNLRNSEGARNPIRDGAEKAADWGELFRDKKYIRISSKFAPKCIGRDRQELILADDWYSGCKVRAVINAFAYDTKGNKGVSFGFSAIQKIADGDNLGGGGADVALFDDLPADTNDTLTDPFA